MNVPIPTAERFSREDVRAAYRSGLRDARHVIAEMLLTHPLLSGRPQGQGPRPQHEPDDAPGVFEPGIDDAQVQRDLDAAGIDMEPAYKRLHEMIAARTDPGILAVQINCIEYHLRKEPSAWKRVQSLYAELRRLCGVGVYRTSDEQAERMLAARGDGTPRLTDRQQAALTKAINRMDPGEDRDILRDLRDEGRAETLPPLPAEDVATLQKIHLEVLQEREREQR